MSKEKNTQQMSLWEGSHVNPSASQENKKVQTMTAISGQKCLDSLGRSNPNSLLGRMCKELLTSKTAWYSDRCKTSWKVKVSKSNVSLFQLQASVLGTKDIESGLWATPNTMDYLPPRSAAGTKKIMEGHRKGRTKPSNLREQVDPETMKIYQDMGQVEKHLRSKKQSFPTPTTFDSNEINKPRKPHPGGGQKPPLNQVVKMYPTPQRSDHLHNQSETLEAWEKRAKQKKEEKGINLQFALRHAVQKEEREEKRMYVTPTTQDARIGPNNIGGNKHRVKRGSIALADQILFPDNTKKKMYPTPTQDSASERTKKYKQGGKPLTVAVQEEEKKKMYPTPRASAAMNENLETVRKRVERRGKLKTKLEETMAMELPKMYPTPTVDCEEGGQQSERVERTKSGSFILRKKNKPESTFGAKLSDAMLYLEKKKLFYSPTTNDSKNLTLPKSQKDRHSIIGDMINMKEMLPTPAQRDYKDVTLSESYKNRNSDSLPIKMMKKNKPGGKLNPTFVEFLMGFPMNWTKTEPTESKPLETQSSHKSQGSSDSQ